MTISPRILISLFVSTFALTAALIPATANEVFVKVSEKSAIISGDGEGGAEIATFHAPSKRPME